MKNSIKKIFMDEKKYWLVSAIFSMALMLLVMSYAGVLGNGKYAYISDDQYEQVASFCRLFYNKLLEGSNIYYSFKAGLGMNTSLLFSFYTLSPLNILYVVFGVESINTASIIIFLLKIGLSAAFFQLYCRYNLKAVGAESLVASICYSLMAYTVYISRMNPLYDAVYMLPLIFILIKYSVEKNTFCWLSITYAYLFIISFYGGYVVGVTSFAYFVYYVIMNIGGLKQRLITFVHYCVAVLLAIAISGFVIAPTLYEALNQKVMEEAFSFRVIPIWEQISYLFPFHGADMYRLFPSYYCGLVILFMVPAFFFNKAIGRNSKIIAGVVLLICFLSMTIKPLYVAGHMFNDPTGYVCRYVYIFSFLLLSMFIKSVQCKEGIEYRKVCLFDGGLLFVYFANPLLDKVLNVDQYEIGLVYYCIGVVFAIIWIVIIQKMKNINQNKEVTFWAVVSFVLCIELGLHNYNMISGIVHPLTEDVDNYLAGTNMLVEELQTTDHEKYRIQYNSSNNTNQGSLFGYMGDSLFASSSNGDLKNFMKSIGIFCNEFMLTDCGNTDFSRMLLNEKYIVNGRKSFDNDKDTGIVLNNNVAGMGYIVSKDAVNYKGDGTIFENQNEICERFGYKDGSLNSAYVGGIDFEPHNIQIASSEDGIILRRESLNDEGYVAIRIPYVDGKKAYIWMNTGYDRPSFESPLVITNDTENICAYMESCLTTSHIFKMAREEDSFCIYIYFGTDAIEEITLYELYLAYSDMATIEDIATGLSAHSLELTEFEDGFIKGNIEAEEDSILFMSVPYERGWMASVDGIKSEIVPLLRDSFIGVPVSEGVHEIELEFIAPYSELGKYMSITGIVLLIIMFCMEWCGRRKLEQK